MPMNEREQALLPYFFAISTDSRVRAAGFSLTKLTTAVVSCVIEDVPGVIRHVTKGAIDANEPMVREATRGVARTVLGGTVSPRVADHAVSALDGLVADGFQWLGKKLAKGSGTKRG